MGADVASRTPLVGLLPEGQSVWAAAPAVLRSRRLFIRQAGRCQGNYGVAVYDPPGAQAGDAVGVRKSSEAGAHAGSRTTIRCLRPACADVWYVSGAPPAKLAGLDPLSQAGRQLAQRRAGTSVERPGQGRPVNADRRPAQVARDRVLCGEE